MGWVILIIFVFLLLVGLSGGLGSECKGKRSNPNQQPENDDDQILEDWYTSQELDNDLDDWDQ